MKQTGCPVELAHPPLDVRRQVEGAEETDHTAAVVVIVIIVKLEAPGDLKGQYAAV